MEAKFNLKELVLGNLLLLLLLGACSSCSRTAELADARPVRVSVVAKKPHQEKVLLTGQIAAHTYVKASFRISGKIVERLVTVGSRVETGQALARLESKIEEDQLQGAKAEVAAAQALLERAASSEKRAKALLRARAVSQSDYEEALRQLKAARAQVVAAEAKKHAATEQVGYTLLKAESNGVVTEKGAEVGEVVGAGQMILRIAENQPRDAIFDLPEALVLRGVSLGQKVEVRLNTDREIQAVGVIYEIAPQADSLTRTYPAKVVLAEFPPQMLLGATVVGTLKFMEEPAIQVPAAALTTWEGQAAVWLVDPKQHTVRITPVRVERYTTAAAIIAAGINYGDIVVTAGTQALHQGQRVRWQGLKDE